MSKSQNLRIAVLVALALVACAQTPKIYGPKAPECRPDYGVISTAGIFGNVVYSCKAGKWVLDEEATKKSEEAATRREQEREDLIWALRTRVLTPAELQRVRDWGWSILIRPMQGYYETEVQKQFNDLLLQQERLRALQNTLSQSPPVPKVAFGQSWFLRIARASLTALEVVNEIDDDHPARDAQTGEPSAAYLRELERRLKAEGVEVRR